MRRSPFKFLDSYGKKDIDQYFGREKETQLLFKKTFESNLVLLYGLSGTGKTSLINCGLNNMFADTDWLPLFIRRTDNIINNLEQVIHEAAFEKEALEGLPVRRQLHSLYLDYYKPIFLIFDQFEELFILGSQEEIEKFFWMLAEILQAGMQVKVILNMREEYLANLDAYERILPNLFDNRLRIERMRHEDIQDVIKKSTAHFGIEMEEPKEKICDRIIGSIENDRGQIDLTYLQVYLDSLYSEDDKRRGEEKRAIRFDTELLRRVGMLDDVLDRFLENQLNDLNQSLLDQGMEEGLALKVLAQLVTNQGTKQPKPVGSVVKYINHKQEIPVNQIEYCIQQLQEMRIIRYL